MEVEEKVVCSAGRSCTKSIVTSSVLLCVITILGSILTYNLYSDYVIHLRNHQSDISRISRMMFMSSIVVVTLTVSITCIYLLVKLVIIYRRKGEFKLYEIKLSGNIDFDSIKQNYKIVRINEDRVIYINKEDYQLFRDYEFHHTF